MRSLVGYAMIIMGIVLWLVQFSPSRVLRRVVAILAAVTILTTAIVMLSSCGRVHERTQDQSSIQCTVTQDSEESTITCPDGTSATLHNGVNGVPGKNGANGVNGTDGKDGKDGANGIDGKDGLNGRDGLDGTQIYSVLPCPEKSGAYGERMLCIGETLYAVYNDAGTTTRLSIVTPGNYVTTDGRNCHFRVIYGCTISE